MNALIGRVRHQPASSLPTLPSSRRGSRQPERSLSSPQNLPNIDQTHSEDDFSNTIEQQSMEDSHLTANQSENPSFMQEPAAIRITIPAPPAQAAPQQTSPVNSVSHSRETCYLRKVCAILISIIVGIFLTLQKNTIDESVDNLYMVAYSCLIYVALENLFVSYYSDRGSSDHKENLFVAVDGLLVLYFLLSIHLQYYEKISKYPVSISPAMFLLATLVYAKQSSAPSSAKNVKIALKLFYTVQVSLLTSKAVGYIVVDWIMVFLPSILYFVGRLIYGFSIVIKPLMQIRRHIRQRETSSSVFLKKIIKVIWHLLYFTMDLFGLVILLNLCVRGKGRRNEEVIRLILKVAGLHSNFFLGYTLVFFRLIKKFNININSDIEESPDQNVKPRAGYSLKVQENPTTYKFLKISSTYFIRVDAKSPAHTEKLTKALEEHKMKSESMTQDSTAAESTQDHSTKDEAIEDIFCYICETNEPDSILMDCGHGGMCMNCAKMSVIKRVNCMECRRPVTSIYRIDKDNANNRLVEAAEVITIIHEMINEEQPPN